MGEFLLITIDGGAASGKSSASRAVAERLDLLHCDTGRQFRTLTHILLEKGVAPDDPAAVRQVLAELKLESARTGRELHLQVDGLVASEDDVRGTRVTENVSAFAAIPELRQVLADFQRSIPREAEEWGYAGIVMEGRDIGSVILPHAPYKFYLQADEATRARRRAAEGRADAVGERDRLDATRKAAPLIVPTGATVIDTGPMTREEVLERLLADIDELRQERGAN